MDRSDELFCSILKAGLWNKTPVIRLSRDDFSEVWKDAVKQVCRGLIGHALVSSGNIPSAVVFKLQDHLLAVAGFGFKMDRVIGRTVPALQAAGIDPVLLKGRGVGTYYLDPMLRENGDVDLYIGPESYKAAFEILAAMSDNPEGARFEADSKHSHVEIDGITVEIHRYCEVLPPHYNARYQEIAKKGLSENPVILRIGEADVRTPETTFNAFFIFDHMWRHFVTEGVGFRQMCDWTMFLHSSHGSIDLPRLKSILESLDLMRAWKVFGQVAVTLLGLPGEEMPFCDPSYAGRVSKVAGMMMREGNFGHEREDWWTVPRESFFDNVRVFFMIARRYFSLWPVFGKVVLVEYISRMRKKFLS